MILISVIIPCYNVEVYVEECLTSVFNQTYQNYEVIVVDNNSTDNTLQKVYAFKETKKVNINIIKEARQGSSFARNAGLAIAKGDWIQFLDADDLLLPKKIEHQINIINENIDFICGATIERKIDGSEFVMKPIDHDLTGLLVGYRSLGSSCSNMWRKASLNVVEGFNIKRRFGVEYELMFRLLQKGSKRRNDYVPLTIVRQRPSGQLTQYDASEYNKEILDLSFTILNYYSKVECNLVKNWTSSNKVKVLKVLMYRLYLQSLEYLDLSHHQYHEQIFPLFNRYFIYMPIREQIKYYLFRILGFKSVRFFLNKIR